MKTNAALGLMLICIMGLMCNTDAASSKKVSTSTTTPSTTTASSPTEPTISYTCFMNDSIVIDTTNLGGYVQYAVGELTMVKKNNTNTLQFGSGNSGKCEWQKNNITLQSNITLTNCKFNSPVFFYIMKAKDGYTVGGKDFHEYKLACNIPDSGISVTISGKPVFNTIAYALKPTERTHPYTISLHMIISPTIVHIADELTVTITDANVKSKGLYVLPATCTASDGSTNVNGFERIDLMTNGSPVDEEVLGKFNVDTQGEATAKMYAFRFLKTDTVVLECSVTVCEAKTCVYGAYESQITTAPVTARKRRRRSPQDTESNETFEVSAGYKIVDKETVESKSSQLVRFDPTVIVSLVMLVCVLWRKD